jgi:dihydroorotate dehydrogenase electron transfer subunit
VFRVVGRGTELLGRVREGEELDVLGPLGRPVPAMRGRDVLLVAGGIGVAPLLLLARRAARGNRVGVVVGARTKRQLLLLREFRAVGVSVKVATDDGSAGQKGVVTRLAEKEVAGLSDPMVFACGPRAMLRDLLPRFDPLQVWGFIEERMGCGTGICNCCALPRRGGGYVRFCEEGPVVLLNEAVL